MSQAIEVSQAVEVSQAIEVSQAVEVSQAMWPLDGHDVRRWLNEITFLSLEMTHTRSSEVEIFRGT